MRPLFAVVFSDARFQARYGMLEESDPHGKAMHGDRCTVTALC